MSKLLLFSVAIIATCGLIYELIAGALASYLLGDSVTQFSTIIGIYLFAMGVGSYISKYVKGNLLSAFVQIELLVGLIGGFSATILFVGFGYITWFRVLLYSLVSITGILVGLEIPLLLRILKDRFEFSDLISKVLSIDYVGALLASLMFPLVLVPHLGLIRSAFLFGILNAGVGLLTLFLFKNEGWTRPLKSMGFVILFALTVGFAMGEKIVSFAENASYSGQIIFAKKSPYQRIIMTADDDGLKLYLNGNLQFSSRDEYRYHEALVHPGLNSVESPRQVLVLGGGDGLAVREILKYPSVEQVVLVDLDPEVTRAFRSIEFLRALNEDALNSAKVKVFNQDAFTWLKQNKTLFDFVVIDFPDPSNFSIGKLYSDTFFRRLKSVLHEDSLISIQSTSPLFATRSYWCVNNTMESVGFKTRPYHLYVPSFGQWGFFLASLQDFEVNPSVSVPTRYLEKASLRSMFVFPKDMARVPAEVQKLNSQVLVRYFEDEWSKVN